MPDGAGTPRWWHAIDTAGRRVRRSAAICLALAK